VRFALLDPNGRLVAEGSPSILREFCVHSNPEMLAEKIFKSLAIHTSSGQRILMDVNNI